MNKLLSWLAAQTTPNAAYQMCHTLLALVVVLAVGRFTGHLLWASAGMAAFALAKEFWFDVTFESTEVAGSGAIDFAFYCLGIGLGYALGVYLP
jgi:hypothetical protein